MKKTISKITLATLLVSTSISNVALAGNYCAGIRGNGELAPAHWSAMSRIIENRGMPQTVAGGSSASITIFFLDALSRNKSLSDNDRALMLKSLVPHIGYLYSEDAKVPEIMKLVGNVTGFGKSGFIGAVKQALAIATNIDTFFEVLGEYGKLLNPTVTKGLRKDFKFYKGQLSEGIERLGAFDAVNDKNIFFRDGLVDFKALGVLLGRLADFYAGFGDEEVNNKIGAFTKECSDLAVGKEWSELVAAKPSCQTFLYSALNEYYADKTIEYKKTIRLDGKKRQVTRRKTVKASFPNKMIFEKIGSGIDALPTTSLVVGDAVQKFKELKQEYKDKGAEDYTQFSLDFDTNLKYGYWGSDNTLDTVRDNLKSLHPNDTKSSKFHGLKSGVWFEVLGTSPAEPGLSSLALIPNGETLVPSKIINKRYFAKKFWILPTLTAIEWFDQNNPDGGISPYRKDIISAGGWSDLHPTLVLRAKGCDDVVYVTRQGGESVFGQQIFIRLTGLTDKISFWKDIKERNRTGVTDLTEEEANSPWNHLFNLANPESSFNTSLHNSDAVYCTNWDKFNILGGEVEQTLTDAYHAPIFLKDEFKTGFEFAGTSANKSKDNFPGCIPFAKE